MKRAARSTSLTHLIIALSTITVLAACKSLFDPPHGARELPTRAEVLEIAQNYYVAGPERPPRDTVLASYPTGHSVPDSAEPVLRIATLWPTAGPMPLPVKLIAQITSNRDYEPMGIRQGRNIVWRDWLGRAWLTPPTGSHRQLQQVPGFVLPLMPGHEPSLYRVPTNSVSFLACLDDCPSGHCGMF